MPDTLTRPAITAAYQRLLHSGKLLPDSAQETAVAQLAQIQESWQASAPRGGLLGRLRGKAKRDADAVQGVYLWGAVGRGKSLLMDLFHDTTPLQPKRRVHYHAFMMDVHARIHAWRSGGREAGAGNDPLPPLADALAGEAKLLCLDELQVTDIADAMLLGRLFSLLFARGVKVVFTSNRQPEALYLHGLQRERFLPFIALVRQRLAVMELLSAEDYRLRQLKAMDEVYIIAPPTTARAKMDAAFARLTHEPPQPRDMEVQGHRLHIPASAGDVARFGFADLCAHALGAADYAAIAQEYATVLLDDIPQLTPEKRNEAKRFVTLIDTLYEHKTKLVCSAAAAPDALYPAGDGSFEFARTASRLMEMQSESYLAASHQVA